jgi:LysM repeat protein
MRAPDKSPADLRAICSPDRPRMFGAVVLALALCFASCNRLATPPAKQRLKDADAKASAGEFLQAIALYEDALDGTARSADIHYKLGLLYDDKMNEPINALHHWKRYLTLSPTGNHAAEVKGFMKRDELALVTSLSGDSVVSRTEAARLRNQNLELQKQIEDRRVADARSAALAKNQHGAQAEKDAAVAKAGKKTARTYVVQEGDTLYSISRKFYKSSSGWKKIRDSDGQRIGDATKLKPGETVTIP